MEDVESVELATEAPAKRKPRPVRKPTRGSGSATPAAGRTSAAKRSPASPKATQWRTPGGRAARLMLRSLALLLLSLCAIEIARLTLTPSPASVGIAHTNLHPFSTIRLYLRYGSLREQILQIGGNIAIGVPLGFLLPQITPRLRGLIRVELATAVFIALIELFQHFFVEGRSFDVDDLILAAIGAAIGYVPLGRMFAMRLHPNHLHWWQRVLARSRARATERRRAR